jgi:hypothetical protein
MREPTAKKATKEMIERTETMKEEIDLKEEMPLGLVNLVMNQVKIAWLLRTIFVQMSNVIVGLLVESATIKTTRTT